MNDYILIYRKLLDSSIFAKPELLRFWLYCLLKATYKHRKVLINGKMIDLKPGEFVFGREAAARELNTTVRKVRTNLDLLKKLQKLAIKTTNKYSIISIVNWDAYQNPHCENGQQNAQKPTSNRPATDQQPTTNNTSNKGKKGKKETIPYNPLNESLPPYIDFETFKGFVDMRESIKKPLTKRSVQIALSKLDKLQLETGANPNDIIDQSVLNGWAGLYPLNGTKGGDNGNGGSLRSKKGDIGAENVIKWAELKQQEVKS